MAFLREDEGEKTISLVILLFLTRFKPSSLLQVPSQHTLFIHRDNSQLFNGKESARQDLSPLLPRHLQVS